MFFSRGLRGWHPTHPLSRRPPVRRTQTPVPRKKKRDLQEHKKPDDRAANTITSKQKKNTRAGDENLMNCYLSPRPIRAEHSRAKPPPPPPPKRHPSTHPPGKEQDRVLGSRRGNKRDIEIHKKLLPPLSVTQATPPINKSASPPPTSSSAPLPPPSAPPAQATHSPP